MQSCTCCKTVLVWPGNFLIGRILLIGSLVFLTQFTRMEAAPLLASPCTLAWNPSLDSTVSGYIVYYGIAGSTTNNCLNVEMTNMVTFDNLLASSNYFFYVVAYTSSGVESSPSKVMFYTPEALAGLQPIKMANGTMNVCFQVATGAVCHLEYTPTLNPPQWQTLASATADANGNVRITDPLTGNPPSRFYRAVVP